MEATTTPSEVSAASSARPSTSFQDRVTTNLANFPWWALVVMLAGLILIYKFATDSDYQNILASIWLGVRYTILVTLAAYSIALVLGLLTALGQLSKSIILKNLAMLYVQIVRGVPIIVQIFYWAFVLTPILVSFVNAIGNTLVSIGLLLAENAMSALIARDINFIVRGILALAFSYGAFSSEIFRAGIQAIGRGQIEAAASLGLTWFQSFRLIILPQAIRRVLPPLGNDFIAMLKESSLVSVIGVQEITQLGKKYAAASFLFPQTYNTVAFLYLSLTLVLSMGVRFMERRLKVAD